MTHTVRSAAGEFLGSAGLAAVVIGSGIAAQRLSPGDVGLQLFENAFATALGLAVLILVFATVSGSHFNPVVTLVDIALHRRTWSTAAVYLPAQVLGCIAGAVVANLMFGAAPVTLSTTDRSAWPLLLSEVVATAGLILSDLRFGADRPLASRRARRGCVHRCGVLLHLVDELCQPCHHHRAHPERHVRRNSPCVRTAVHRRAAPGRGARLGAVRVLFPVALPEPAVSRG